MLIIDLFIATYNLIAIGIFIAGIAFVIVHGNGQYIKTHIMRECPICCINSNQFIICKHCLGHVCLLCYIKQIWKKCSYCRK